MTLLTIGKLAELTGITPDTLRYYEKMKLITAQSRSAAGYRQYDSDSVRVVRFIRGAKALNFTLEEIRKLLTLDSSDQSTCAEILKHTECKIAEAELKILELNEIKNVLKGLVKACPGDATSVKACPILDHIKNTVQTLATVALLTGSLMLADKAEAKPISYVGGLMVMQENDETGSTLSLDYTISPRYAIGLYAKRENGGSEFTTVGPQINALIKRWNLPDGQGNIFSMTGAGISHYQDEKKFTAWTGMLADYETRRIFTSYEARLMAADTIEQSFWQRARVGFAPYVTDYDSLHTWLMVQVDNHPAKEDSIVVTPLVRIFYHTLLVEGGISNNGDGLFNWVVQF
jgi:DNA-binding transcriptional MerR regulator